jgi:hypothetical protein
MWVRLPAWLGVAMRTARFATLALLWCAGITLMARSARAELASDPPRTEPAGSTHLTPMNVTRVPPELRPWLPWVLDELGDRICPIVNGSTVCAWPGRLRLDLGDSGGRFHMKVVVDRETFVALPGAKNRWPLDVRTQNGPAVVLERNGVPSIKLAMGSHDIDGRFQWARLPETLTISERIGLVDLRLNGTPVTRPKRDGGLLWLASAPRQADDQERLEVEVFRQVQDGVPLLVTTLLRLTVSGRAREVALNHIWLNGAVPLGVEADLPVRVDTDASIAAQVFAGKHEIKLYEAHPDAQTDLTSPNLPPPWPEAETWSLLTNDALRQLRLSGVSASDPNRANVPSEWASLPAYSVPLNTKVSLLTERRGDPNPAPNRLNFTRDLWLDLNGDGFTVRDNITGKLSQSWRIDLLHGELGQARLNDQPQLITQHPTHGSLGVELRDGELQLTADWRISGNSRTLPAVGWSENADVLTTHLHLPPGWTLLGATGVDVVERTWLASWDLLTLFFVLIVAFAIARLTHFSVGALAMLTLVLLHNQDGAPSALWLAVLVAIALLRVVPSGKVRRVFLWFGYFVGAALILVIVTFAVDQLKLAFFPQTKHLGETFVETAAQDVAPEAAPVPALKRELAEESSYAPEPARAAKSTRLAYHSTADSKSVIQTGPGVPAWSWETWSLNWSGPVHRDHQVRLYLLSPTFNALLSFLRVGLGGLLAFLVVQLLFRQAQQPPTSNGRSRLLSSSALFGTLIASLAATLFATTPAHAQFPPSELLTELRKRAEEPAICEPECVTVQRAHVEVSDAGLVIFTEVHVDALSSARLPGPDKEWIPAEVRINGRAASGLLRGADGFVYARLEPGIHRIEMSGPLKSDTLALNLGTPPHFVTVNAPGWTVSGLNEVGQVDSALSLHRNYQLESNDSPNTSGTLSGWLRVHRTLSFGKTWSILTNVERVGETTLEADDAVSARIPLLAGERVTTAGVPVEKDSVNVTLERSVRSISYQSTLDQRDVVSLVAATFPKLADQRFNEQWTIDCSPQWHCEIDGLAPLSRQREGRWSPTFVPWPGERVDVRLSRPEPAAGVSTTIDSAHLTLTPGIRLMKARLSAHIRTSTQHNLSVKLPEGIVLSEVALDGVAQTLQLEHDTVLVQLQPGHHVVDISWQEQGGMRALFRSSSVQLDQTLVNAKVTIFLPSDRWLLLAGGGGWGPAVLFWGYLALLLMLAPILARLPGSPLDTLQWSILGLGFTQVPVVVAGMVVGWFFLFAHSDNLRPRTSLGHNAFQLALVFATGIFITCLFGAVYDGLLSSPQMRVAGSGSTNRELNWYVDRTDGAMPEPWVLTTSLWAWRISMLAWAVWLASRLLNWLRWGWEAFSRHGIWRVSPAQPATAPAVTPRDSRWMPTTVESPVPPESRRESDAAEPGRPSIDLTSVTATGASVPPSAGESASSDESPKHHDSPSDDSADDKTEK